MKPSQLIKLAQEEVKQMSEEEKKQRRERLFARGDDCELADRLADELCADRPWVYTNDAFWKYNEHQGTWERQDSEDLKLLVKEYAGRKIFAGKDDTTNEAKTRTLHMGNGKVTGTVSLLQANLHNSTFFDDAPAGIAFKNSFVRVTDVGEIVQDPHRPENKARYCMPFSYREHPCIVWRQFLRDIFFNDEDALEKIEALREFIGLCLIGEIWSFEKALILVGSGSNGKSVLLDVIGHLFPEDSKASIAPQQWDHEYYRARLYGVAMNIVSELPERDILDSQSFKAVISGDMIEARRPRENTFSFRPRAGHIFAANPPLPNSSDFSRGFWRRWIILQFNRTFVAQDAMLKSKLVDSLRGEAPGIVFWAIEGAARAIRARAIQNVASSDEALRRWKHASDPVAMFVEEELKGAEGGDETSAGVIYAEYRKWCGAAGSRALGRPRFLERLEGLGHKPSAQEQGVFLPLQKRHSRYDAA